MNLYSMYKRLYNHFGPQNWWPADSPFEVMVGAILTQNTNWANVKKAIDNLKYKNLLKPEKLYKLDSKKLAALIKPSGYYNLKAERLKEFVKFFFKAYEGNLKNMSLIDTSILREQLLSVKGIGPETADSILLYALNKPIFVVDAYTKRMLLRHRMIKEGSDYASVQSLFMKNLRLDAGLFNEYHALLVRLGKDMCLKNKPKCQICPLQ